MLRLVVLLFFFSLPSLTFSQLRIQAFDNQPVRYFIKKNGKEVEITKEQAYKLFPPEKEAKNAYVDAIRIDYSPYGYTKKEFDNSFKIASLQTSFPHDYLVQCTYCDFGEVQQKIMAFVQEVNKWEVVGMDKIKGSNIWVQKYRNTGVFSNNRKPGKVNVRYNLFKNKFGNEIIKDITFSGDWDMLVSFYIRFWDTNLHITPELKSISYNHFWQDKIMLSSIDTNGEGKLIITNSQIKNEQDYDTYLKNSVLNKSKAPNKNTVVKDSIKM